jgi:DNA-binding beta-propeller fold protein YncE
MGHNHTRQVRGFINRRAIFGAIVVTLALAPLAGRPQVARALSTDIAVNTTAIADDPEDGACDLWEAMQAIYQANSGLDPAYHECEAGPEENVISFEGSAAGSTIMIPTGSALRTELPFVHGVIVIRGPITLHGGGDKQTTPIFRLGDGAHLTLKNVVVENAHTTGSGSVIEDNHFAVVNIVESTLQNNSADEVGGAIISNGTLNIMESTIANNQALGLNGDGLGGAVFMQGSDELNIANTTFSGNTADNAGGALYIQQNEEGTTTLGDVTFTSNSVESNTNDLAGGAIFNYSGVLLISRSMFNTNLATLGSGGAIVNNIIGTAVITDTVFNGNIASGGPPLPTGGAIANLGDLSIDRSTFIANEAHSGRGGALANGDSAVALIVNSTFNGNSASTGGGAIDNAPSTGDTSMVTVTNSTIASNDSNGGAIANSMFQVIALGNTIVDQGGNGTHNCSGNIVSLGHNLDSDSSCDLHASGDLTGSANLGSLLPNGGALPVLLTQRPNPGSPAIDHGAPAICSGSAVNDEDENGSLRPKDGDGDGTAICDIGAVEALMIPATFDADPLPPGPNNFGSVEEGMAGANSFSVSNPGDFPLLLSAPIISDPSHFSVTSTFPISLPAHGQQTLNLSCSPSSSGPLTGTFTFHTSDPHKPSLSYTLYCLGVATPAAALAAVPVPGGPIDFGNITIGSITTQTVQIANHGTAQLDLSSISISGDATFGRASGPALSLAPAASGLITITCKPFSVGLRTARLYFTTNDPSQHNPQYNMTCAGIPPDPDALVNTQNLKPPIGLPITLSKPAGLAVSPDGHSIYVSANGTPNPQIIALRWSSGLGLYLPGNGGDSRIDLAAPRLMAVSPDGKYLFATGFTYSRLLVYLRDPGTGALVLQHSFQDNHSGVNGIGGTYGVAFSPDSRFAYVTGYSDNAVGIFARTVSDTFQFDSFITATSLLTHPLAQPRGLAVSPDGRNLYVASSAYTGTGTLAVYSRNPATGRLTPLQTRYEGDCQDAIRYCFMLYGLRSLTQLAVSPDGNNVYSVGAGSGAVVNFRRDPLSGKLHWAGTLNAAGGVPGLRGASGVAVSPDGKRVQVTGRDDNALVVLSRDLATGALSFKQLLQRNAGTGQPALRDVGEVAVSPDSRQVFAAGYLDNAVAIFQVANPAAVLYTLQPASVQAGSAAFTLVIKGHGFVGGARTQWNSYQAPTVFINETEVRASIPASWVSSAGKITIGVANPLPGGGPSFNVLTFTINAPAVPPIPSIDHLNPASVMAGSSATLVDVYGSNFLATTMAYANGMLMTATFVDTTHLRVNVLAAQLAQPGTLGVRVNNKPTDPNSVPSNLVALTVSAPGQNPVPLITALNPKWVFSHGAGSSSFTLLVYGTNFVDGAVVLLDGNPRPTRFVSAVQLKVTILAADQYEPGQHTITVRNPAPGGGESTTAAAFAARPLYQWFIPEHFR